jgi:uncharacterized protein YbaP (TraB family)
MSTGPYQMTPRQYELMLLGRNRNWIPKLEGYLATGGYFVAVGAGHLPGAGGLLELLSARGYVVERSAE